jgi:hypothetical protein
MKNNMNKIKYANFEKEDCLYIYELNAKSCIDCGNKYYISKYSKNKLNFLIKRQLGIPTKLIKSNNIKEYINENCFCCEKNIKDINIYTPINSRRCYIVGIGQFCSDCYAKFA